MLVVGDAGLLVAPIRPAQGTTKRSSVNLLKNQIVDLMRKLVLNKRPGVRPAKRRRRQRLLIQDDLPRGRACTSAIRDPDRDLMVDEVPIERACLEGIVNGCSRGLASPVEDVVASSGLRQRGGIKSGKCDRVRVRPSRLRARFGRNGDRGPLARCLRPAFFGTRRPQRADLKM